VSKGKKFKRGLPKRQMFIFEDPKEAGKFYEYVNIKFQLANNQVYDDVPFQISGQRYFFSFYEVDIPDKTINLFPLLIEHALHAAMKIEDEDEAIPEEIRKDNYYIAIEVYSDIENDCLLPHALSKETVLNYLSALRKEYMATNNYNELVFKD
jgi:hypothetical protein